ncbi:hypothetical protein ScPMuIL_005504 [Solemya velum]
MGKKLSRIRKFVNNIMNAGKGKEEKYAIYAKDIKDEEEIEHFLEHENGEGNSQVSSPRSDNLAGEFDEICSAPKKRRPRKGN